MQLENCLHFSSHCSMLYSHNYMLKELLPNNMEEYMKSLQQLNMLGPSVDLHIFEMSGLSSRILLLYYFRNE